MTYERSAGMLSDRYAIKQKWWWDEALKYEFNFSLVLEIEWVYFLALATFNETNVLSRTMPASLLSPAAICKTSKEGELIKKEKK